jgi:hypothetical protein
MNFPERPEKNNKDRDGSNPYEREREAEELTGPDNPGSLLDKYRSKMEAKGIPITENSISALAQLIRAEDSDELQKIAHDLGNQEDYDFGSLQSIRSLVHEEKDFGSQ